MTFRRMSEMDLAGKRVLIREDMNVPIKDGRITSDQRIRAVIPTITHAKGAGAKIVLMSHLGRPKEGEFTSELSLQPVADALSGLLGTEVPLLGNYLYQPPVQTDGDILMLENVRFNVGEKANDDALAQRYATLGDVYVMDAFGTSHRAHASTHGVAKFIREACAGPLLCVELEALAKVTKHPKRPMTAIVGGSKVSTKLTVLDSLLRVVDQLIPGGGIANTFIAAAGFNVGKSLYEPGLVHEAQKLMQTAKDTGTEIPMPTDVVVGKEFSEKTVATIKPVNAVDDADMIFDIGPETARRYADLMQSAATIVWNGPLGVFEFDQFGEGTQVVARAIADSDAFSVAGGGDTLAAVDKYGLADQISYISTGGGAFLEFLQGEKLPAVTMLEQRGAP